MCLIEVKLTPKASEGISRFFFIRKYKEFFVNCKIMYAELEGEKFVVRVYVRFPENKVSWFIENNLAHDSKIQKVKIVS